MVLLLASVAWSARFSVDDALQHALHDNLELAQQRRGNAIVRHRLRSARARFDPRLQVAVRADQDKTPSNQAIDVQGGMPTVVTSTGLSWNVGLSAELPTGGSVSADLSEFRSTTDSANALSDSFVRSRAAVSIAQPLLRGAGLGALAELRDAHLEMAAQDVRWRAQVESAVLDVSGAYWGLLSARGALAIARRGVELAEQQLTETLERQDAGFAGSGDVLQVRVSLGQARRTAVDARARVGEAEQRLARWMGLPLAEAATIELTDRPALPSALPSRAVLLAEARDGNAALALARIQFERAKRAARRARNGALPDLDLNGSAGWAAGGVDASEVRSDLIRNPAPSVGVGVSLGLPVVPREARATLGIARLELERAELTQEAAEVDLVLAVDGALRDLQRDQSGLEAARQTLEHAQASLGAQQELLTEGRGSTRDVVDALESLRSAEIAELDAEIAVQSSLLRALRVAGTLVTTEQVEAAPL